jgi:hypothetical protein
MTAEHPGDFLVQVVQGVPVLAEDNNLPHAPACIVHLRLVLKDARKLIPLAVLAQRPQAPRLLFKTLKADDFRCEFGNSLRSRRLIDKSFLQVFLLLSIEVVVVIRNVGDSFCKDLLTA